MRKSPNKKLFNFITYEFFSFLYGWDMMGSATITTRIQWGRGGGGGKEKVNVATKA